ncbi:MAG: helix-turn-helix domain-containing protein [Desulfovibrio sp.]|nr:helix-turn-helix domain-containing protein [Desulfovibrio sp.]
MVINEEDYGKIRQYWLGGMSQRQIARQLGFSRNTVRKYCEGESVPWKRKAYVRAPTVLTEEVQSFIAHCLAEEKDGESTKQRKTARGIYDRLVEEKGFSGGESTIRKYVKELRERLCSSGVPCSGCREDRKK